MAPAPLLPYRIPTRSAAVSAPFGTSWCSSAASPPHRISPARDVSAFSGADCSSSGAVAPAKLTAGSLSCGHNPLMKQRLGALQFSLSARGQILPRPIDVERQHPHPRRRSFRRNLLRCELPRNRLRILVEQPCFRIRRDGFHSSGPFPPSMRVCVRFLRGLCRHVQSPTLIAMHPKLTRATCPRPFVPQSLASRPQSLRPSVP